MPANQLYMVLFALYWAQGLPVGFMTHALPVILRHEGVSLTQIGGLGLLMLPWSLKVLWAPWIDRVGHEKKWIVILQIGMIMLLMGLSFFPFTQLQEPSVLMSLAAILLIMNLMGATQDIATDAWAVKTLDTQQQHWGNTLQVIGSRLGFIVGGGMMLWWFELWSWQIAFLLLAMLVIFNSCAIFLQRPAPHLQRQRVSWNRQYIRIQLKQFWQDPNLRLWFWVLISFKMVDGLSGALFKPMMVDLGLSLSQIGLYITMLGAIAALLGAGLAGFLLKYYSRASLLWYLSVLKLMSLGGYIYLASVLSKNATTHTAWIYLINAIEDTLAAMLLVVMLTLIMQHSRKSYAGTDFTLQVALMATVSGVLYSMSGFFADQWGYLNYLYGVLLVGVICLVPIWLWRKQVS